MKRAWSYGWEVVTPCSFNKNGDCMREHLISKVISGSIAEEMEIESGDVLLTINDNEIEDIFDYRYLIMNEYLEVLIRKPSGEEWLLEIDKDDTEDLGLEFEQGLMDNYRSCRNKCIFCFIDQMPPGMRSTLYFKDDDSRLSFLQGNYVTLTNMSDHDVDRIIKYRLEPINISFQTTDPELRCMMTGNRFAGQALEKANKLFEAGIRMNGQIVLCKGINDGDNLRRSLDDLLKFVPVLESVSIVPVGLSKYREGLYPLEPFAKEDAIEVINIVEEYQRKALEVSEYHFVHASDEFYLLAQKDMPCADSYDGYLQLENGVGMLRLLDEEVDDALADSGFIGNIARGCSEPVALATGLLAADFIENQIEKIRRVYPSLKTRVFPIRNDFFGERITVSGLITGQDIIKQLQGILTEKVLLIPENMLRADETVFLDDVTLEDLEKALQVNVRIVKSDGMDFVRRVLGE